MPVSWWTVKATLNGTLILDDEMKVPSVIQREGVIEDEGLKLYGMANEALNHIAETVYGLAQCMLAPAGAQLDIIIQQIQTPWWWD